MPHIFNFFNKDRRIFSCDKITTKDAIRAFRDFQRTKRCEDYDRVESKPYTILYQHKHRCRTVEAVKALWYRGEIFSDEFGNDRQCHEYPYGMICEIRLRTGLIARFTHTNAEHTEECLKQLLENETKAYRD